MLVDDILVGIAHPLGGSGHNEQVVLVTQLLDGLLDTVGHGDVAQGVEASPDGDTLHIVEILHLLTQLPRHPGDARPVHLAMPVHKGHTRLLGMQQRLQRLHEVVLHAHVREVRRGVVVADVGLDERHRTLLVPITDDGTGQDELRGGPLTALAEILVHRYRNQALVYELLQHRVNLLGTFSLKRIDEFIIDIRTHILELRQHLLGTVHDERVLVGHVVARQVELDIYLILAGGEQVDGRRRQRETLVLRQVGFGIEVRGHDVDSHHDDERGEQRDDGGLYELTSFFHLFKKLRLPFSAQERDARPQQEEEGDGDEVDDVTAVDDTHADVSVVVLDADFLDDVASVLEEPAVVDEEESVVHDKAEEGGQQESDDLVFGDAGGEKPDGDEDGSQHEKTEVGAPGGTHVDPAVGCAQRPHRPEIDERGQQGDEQQRLTSQELGGDEFVVGNGLRKQQLHGARLALLCEHTHGDGGNEEEEDQRGDVEKSLEGRASQLHHIAFQHPYKQPGDHQEHPDDDIPEYGGEERLDFFGKKCKHLYFLFFFSDFCASACWRS